MKCLELFARNLREDFFLKIGLLYGAKVYTKNVPNIEVCDFFPASRAQNSVYQASHCSAV